MEAPFSDQEKRIVLTEAIKTSSISVEQILAFIAHSNVEPVWETMILPFGRNLNSCRNVWDTLRGTPPSNVLGLSAPPERKRKSAPEALEPFQAAPQPKRRQSGADNLTHIRPKPSSDSPQSFSASPATQPPKKRGRPSKADVEARHAAAIARGEVIPPPKTPGLKETKGGEPSTGPGVTSGLPGVVAIAPMLAPAPESGVSTATSAFQHENRTSERSSEVADKKKRGRSHSRASQEQPKSGEITFSALNQPLNHFQLTRPRAEAAEERPGPSSLPLPSTSDLQAEDHRSATPIPKPPQELISPDTTHPQRSDI